MKRTILITLLAVIVTLIATLTAFEIQAQRDQLSADETENIDSKILNGSRKLLVHLPKSYSSDQDKNYPVLYALDATSHDRDVLNAATVLNLAGVLPEVIVVGIVNENRNLDLTPNYIMVGEDPSELGGGDAFLDFLKKEAIPLMEKKYRTSGYRMLSGKSRAGLFTLFAMLEEPNLFNAYFCYSPAFWRNENLIVDKAKTFLAQARQLDQFLYMSLGDQENDKMKMGFDEMVKILEKNDTTDLKFFYHYTANANHQSNAYYSIPPALRKWNDERSSPYKGMGVIIERKDF